MALVHLRLLGGFDCRSAAGEALTFPTRKVRALFAYLAVTAGRYHDRDRLACLLWGDKAEAEAGRSALRLAPYHPEWYAAFVGIALFSARLYEEAIATMTPAPEAICDTPALIAAAYAHRGQPEKGARYWETVYRHHRRQLARGAFPANTDCIDWLLAMNLFRRASDAEHFANGLRKGVSSEQSCSHG